MNLQGYKDLIIYQKSYKAAMEAFRVSMKFPKEEVYSMTDQIRRPSRSICANLGEAYAKGIYPKYFISKLSDCDGERTGTMIHLDFCKDCGYIDERKHAELVDEYLQTGKMLGSMMSNPETFLPKGKTDRLLTTKN